jgi:hypothetical protein
MTCPAIGLIEQLQAFGSILLCTDLLRGDMLLKLVRSAAAFGDGLLCTHMTRFCEGRCVGKWCQVVAVSRVEWLCNQRSSAI